MCYFKDVINSFGKTQLCAMPKKERIDRMYSNKCISNTLFKDNIVKLKVF